MLGRVVVGAALGAGLGAAWMWLRDRIVSGRVCTQEDWGCLELYLVMIPVGLVAAVLISWAVFAAAHVGRPLGTAAVSVAFAAALALLTVWFEIPGDVLLTSAVGFVLASPVTARRPVVHTAARG
ncbi:hypothetical protein KCV87_17955 [Actinosynnema pretiosum subsp. pretiosum]|uniref:Uncharacterized protein n=2 Tax=Actinosynnema TaxID=40566 RepID=C6WI32_ACTMD|nr:hypothetical protein [Actinosynnema mirum]ACU34483.1 hypothetical protein Amir_0516 [Actinosynnema mirum DSM 43827]QUF01460.1 hypothetical protein KCV87_17955 [Actinosynnema pretiosum subsp. pretiosum]